MNWIILYFCVWTLEHYVMIWNLQLRVRIGRSNVAVRVVPALPRLRGPCSDPLTVVQLFEALLGWLILVKLRRFRGEHWGDGSLVRLRSAEGTLPAQRFARWMWISFKLKLANLIFVTWLGLDVALFSFQTHLKPLIAVGTAAWCWL